MLDNAREHIADPEFQQDMLETVDNTVGNMKDLISRLKTYKEKPQHIGTPVDLKKTIADAVLAVGRNVIVKGESVYVEVDETEIYKVILNLLINAHEASEPEQPISIQYYSKDDVACVEVTDSGSGMSSEFIRDSLFIPFTTTKQHGFGIGLYQCQQIIESFRGLKFC